MLGNDFDDLYSKLPKSIFESTFYECENNIVQTSTYLEHKIRLSILKNAVDYKLYKNAGEDKLTTNFVGNNSIFGRNFKMLCVLPENLKKILTF